MRDADPLNQFNDQGRLGPDDEYKTDDGAEPASLAASLNWPTLRELLGNRNFVPLWIGQAVSYIGDQFILIAMVTLLTSMSRSASGGGDVLPLVYWALSLAVPQILFGLISGVLVDRADRKLTMIASDVICALAMFVLPLVDRQMDRLWIVYTSTFVFASATMLFYPARASALTVIMPKRTLAAANALLELGFVVALIFGSGLAGILIESLGENAAFIFNGLTFVFSALMLMLVRIPKRPSNETFLSLGTVLRELRQGLAYVWTTRSLRFIMALNILVSGALGAVTILVLDYLTKELRIGASGFGIVIGILGLGVVVGAIVIQRLSRYLPTNRLVAISLILQAVAVGAFLGTPIYGVVLVMTVLIGFSLVVSRTVLSTLIQAIPPEHLRGRVQSTFNLLSQAPLAAAIGVFGAFVEQVGRGPAILAFCTVLLLTAWFAATTLRGIDEMIYAS